MIDRRIPKKGDRISLKGCFGTSDRTIWRVATNIDRDGYATIKSVKSGLSKRVMLDDTGLCKINPMYKPSVYKKIKYINID